MATSYLGRVVRAVGSATLLMALTLPWAQAQPTIQPVGGVWESSAGFEFKKKEGATRRSVSGIACNLSTTKERVCLVAFDEGVEARYATLGAGSMLAHKEVVALRADTGELDAEGAATDGTYFYVTGSHSAKRSDCKSNADSRRVVRFRVDPATGRGARVPPGAPNAALAGYADTDRLWAILQTLPELKGHVGDGKCLGSDPPAAPRLAGQQGVNIEGLAVKAGRLYFGFRGPALDGAGLVLAVDTEALFGGGDPRPTVTRIALGEGRGLRDMVAVEDGFLLLAGPDDSASNQNLGWTVLWWDGRGGPRTVQAKMLAALDVSQVRLRACDREIKPEAITVIAQRQSSYQVLILSDGMCDGGPLEFQIPR
ncbi:MAG: DUF3616 domain-containing protein [Rhodoferax sp.]|nr:DUF3616 domain-containing protein [Rhodoferax sp.]